MTKSQLIPIRIAKQIDSRLHGKENRSVRNCGGDCSQQSYCTYNPSLQPSPTSVAVTEVSTYPIVKAEKTVSVILREEKRMTAAPVPIAIAAAT